uniref:Cytochrome P450 4c3 n=1 Tax=Caenorhabditis tropicalis TaxID=1561998 RepID=A0A1I7TAU2_9PELO
MISAVLILVLTYLLFVFYQKRTELRNFLNVRRICLEEFEKVPGPPAVPILGSTWYFKSDPVEMTRLAQSWFNEYTLSPNSNGLIKFWMGPVPVVSINRGEVAKIIFDSSTNITKSSQYDKLKEWIGDGLLISTGSKWKFRRKMLTQTFHFAVLKEYQKIFGAQGKVLVDVLKLRANNTYQFDIMPYIKRCTLDIICEDTKRLAFLDYLIKSQSEHPEILTDEGIREEVDTFMFEGHDTTSSGITFAIWFLGQHPEYQQRVQDELDEIFGDDFERQPNSEDIQKMIFLEQCIKETLRLTPPVPFISRKLEEDVLIPHTTKSPVLLPAGLNVMINIISIMKDARYFEKPYEFFPDHFTPERVNSREAFAFVPFSAGPRNCIGEKWRRVVS